MPIESSVYFQKIAPGIKRLVDEIIISGQGCRLQMKNGKSYLDLTSGLGVTVLGHSHPKVTEAIINQASKLTHQMMNVCSHQPSVELVHSLSQIFGDSHPNGLGERFFFWNSGSEAVEAAIKVARHSRPGRPNVIAFIGGYHGRTMGAMALTTSGTVYRAGFGPLMGGVHYTDFPYRQHCEACRADSRMEECTHWKSSLHRLFKTQTAPSETCAIIVEPILGEGGYVDPPLSFLKELKEEFCVPNDILLIVDEVQTGFGRTGDIFAYMNNIEDEKHLPDIVVFAKGIANGLPLSGITGSANLFDSQAPGSMGGTFGGNPIACAAAVATIRAIKDEGILENVKIQSSFAFNFLNRLKEELPVGTIVDIRGRGLMIGIEFGECGIAQKIVDICVKKHQALLLKCGIYDTIRLIPPLNITTNELEEGLSALRSSIFEVI